MPPIEPRNFAAGPKRAGDLEQHHASSMLVRALNFMEAEGLLLGQQAQAIYDDVMQQIDLVTSRRRVQVIPHPNGLGVQITTIYNGETATTNVSQNGMLIETTDWNLKEKPESFPSEFAESVIAKLKQSHRQKL